MVERNEAVANGKNKSNRAMSHQPPIEWRDSSARHVEGQRAKGTHYHRTQAPSYQSSPLGLSPLCCCARSALVLSSRCPVNRPAPALLRLNGLEGTVVQDNASFQRMRWRVHSRPVPCSNLCVCCLCCVWFGPLLLLLLWVCGESLVASGTPRKKPGSTRNKQAWQMKTGQEKGS
jgi:hypothetical protein